MLGPLVRHCPTALHAAILGPLLPALLRHLLLRLRAGYAAMAARAVGEPAGAGAGAGGAGGEREGIVADQAVGDSRRARLSLPPARPALARGGLSARLPFLAVISLFLPVLSLPHSLTHSLRRSVSPPHSLSASLSRSGSLSPLSLALSRPHLAHPPRASLHGPPAQLP